MKISAFLVAGKDSCSNVKVNDNGAGINYGCDQGGGHDRRIQVKFFCDQRKGTADQFGKDHSDGQGQRNYKCKLWITVHYKDPQSVDQRQTGAYKEGDPKFFEHDPKNIPELYFIQSQSADNKGRALRTAVSASIHQHGDKGYQKRYCRKSVFVFCDDGSGNGCGQHQE